MYQERDNVKDSMSMKQTYNFCVIVFEAVRLHIPDDLMTKQLRNRSGFKDESLDILCTSE